MAALEVFLERSKNQSTLSRICFGEWLISVRLYNSRPHYVTMTRIYETISVVIFFSTMLNLDPPEALRNTGGRTTGRGGGSGGGGGGPGRGFKGMNDIK